MDVVDVQYLFTWRDDMGLFYLQPLSELNEVRMWMSNNIHVNEWSVITRSYPQRWFD